MELAPDFREFLSLLLSQNVRFLLVGAHALAVHGRPRYTGDLDVWVAATPANARRVIAALRAFGFGAVGLSLKDFTGTDQVIQLGYPPLRIDGLTASIAGLEVPVPGRDDYLTNKRAAGRPKDLADIALLEEDDAPQPANGKRRRTRR